MRRAFTRKLLLIAAGALVLAGAVIAWHVRSSAMTEEEVLARAFSCYEHNDAGCLVDLATHEEVSALNLRPEVVAKALAAVRTDLGGDAQSVSELKLEKGSNGTTGFKRYRTASGREFTVSFLAAKFDEGAKIGGVTVGLFVSPLVTYSVNGKPPPEGLSKIARLYQVAKYGQNRLQPLGLSGWAGWSQEGFRSNTWQGIEDLHAGRLRDAGRPLPGPLSFDSDY